MNNFLEVYKSARNYIITLRFDPLKTKHNLDRARVVDAQHAKFRCESALVVRIENKDNPQETIDSIPSDYDANFVYKVGETVSVSDYVDNKNIVCGNGIHFYKTKETAWKHNKFTDVVWHENFLEVYKSVDNYIITLRFDPLKTKHNLNREGVIDAKYAKYMCQKALVVSIENKDNPQETIDSIPSDYIRIVIYKVGKTVSVSDEVGGKGIYFYKTKEAAWYHDKEWHLNQVTKFTGVMKIWHESGQLKYEQQYENGEKHGTYKRWYENGQLQLEYQYKNGKLHGTCKEWNENNKLKYECQWKHGKYINKKYKNIE